MLRVTTRSFHVKTRPLSNAAPRHLQRVPCLSLLAGAGNGGGVHALTRCTTGEGGQSRGAQLERQAAHSGISWQLPGECAYKLQQLPYLPVLSRNRSVQRV